MFAKGVSSVVSEKKQKITDADIVSYYLGITKIPIRISSPLRKDQNPSFGLFSFDGKKIFYKDFATQETGSIISLFQKMWNMTYIETWNKIVQDLTQGNNVDIKKSKLPTNVDIVAKTRCNLKVKVRNWLDYDEQFWTKYGITIDWLKYANVHPISHIMFLKNGQITTTLADKYAYAYAEFKEGKVTFKIYQPYNTKGFKWLNNHDGSVISLWTQLPETGDKLCICSSLKDALCLWANTGIPTIAPQGEGYGLSDHAIKDLKERFKKIYIIFDNDEPGLRDSEKLAKATNFTNITLPFFEGGKDISDLYKILNNKQKFLNIFKQLKLL